MGLHVDKNRSAILHTLPTSDVCTTARRPSRSRRPPGPRGAESIRSLYTPNARVARKAYL